MASANIMRPEKPDERSSYCTSIPLALSYGTPFPQHCSTLNVIFYSITLGCVLMDIRSMFTNRGTEKIT